jgi:hypothetical protein
MHPYTDALRTQLDNVAEICSSLASEKHPHLPLLTEGGLELTCGESASSAWEK